MKKRMPALLIVAISFLSRSVIFCQASEHRIRATYDLTYQIDSTDIKSRRTEQMYLFAGDKTSLFLSRNSFIQDSVEATATFAFDPQILKLMQENWTNFKYEIEKDSLDNIYYTDFISGNRFQYVEKKAELVWTILADTMTIIGYKSQKAICNFGGRTWIAWFSADVPIFDGPYKFCNLPGLIIKIADPDNYYAFTLTELIRYDRKIFRQNRPFTKYQKTEFYSTLDYYRKNQLQLSNLRGVKIIQGEDEIKKRFEERLKRENNPIELISIGR